MPQSFESSVRAMSVGLGLAALSTAAVVHAQSTPPMHLIYVDASALPGGDGSDWLHAFRDLQDALAMVPSHPEGTTPDRYVIRISQGLYKPDRGTLDRSATFVVNSAATLMGGFGGLLASDPDSVDPTQFVSVLSGDLRGDDGPNFANTSDNSFHVATLRGGLGPWTLSDSWRLKLYGLTVTAGNAEGDPRFPFGAGVLGFGIPNAVIEAYDCKIIGNRASYASGMAIAGYSNCSMYSMDISDNLGLDGVAGASFGNGGTYLDACTVLRNHALGNAWPGGGLLAENTSIAYCTIADNTGSRGAGAHLSGSSSVQGSTIAGNTASLEGGGLQFDVGSACFLGSTIVAHNAAPSGAGIDAGGMSLSITNCTLTRNMATDSGGGLRVGAAPSTAQIVNTILWNNAAPDRSNVSSLGGTTTIDHSVVQSGASSVAAVLGTGVTTADPLFVDPIGNSSSPTSWADKDYRLGPASPCIDSGAPSSFPYGYGYIDAGGRSRYVNSTCAAHANVDIGAYEFQDINCPSAIPLLFVRASALSGGDGRSWATAFRDIQDALSTPGVTEVWIAEGTYHADRGTGDRLSVYLIEKQGVSLHGGFAGSETDRSQRNIAAHPTVLSADLLENDGAAPPSRIDNGLGLLSISLTPPGDTVGIELSGLTFTGARNDAATSSGWTQYAANIYAQHAPVHLSDCTFTANEIEGSDPTYGASALTIYAASIHLERCRFIDNSTSGRGGGVSAGGGPIELTDCQFLGNLAGGGGGAIDAEWDAATTLRRCSFIGNAAVGTGIVDGGAASLGDALIDSCTFIGNVAMSVPSEPTTQAIGGGVHLRPGAGPGSLINCLFAGNRTAAPDARNAALTLTQGTSVLNCTFADNAAGSAFTGPGVGAAISVAPNSYFANCIFWNSAAFGSGQQSSFGGMTYPDGSPLLTNCLMQGAVPTNAVRTRNLEPHFTNPAGPDGIFGTADDDYSLRPDSPAIDAADSSLLPAGATLDLAGHSRFFDAPGVPNTGLGTPNFLDIGAYEFDGHACAADFNASGALSAQDIFDFLAAWFAQSPAADFNHSGAITSQDIFDFLTAWFAGC